MLGLLEALIPQAALEALDSFGTGVTRLLTTTTVDFVRIIRAPAIASKEDLLFLLKLGVAVLLPAGTPGADIVIPTLRGNVVGFVGVQVKNRTREAGADVARKLVVEQIFPSLRDVEMGLGLVLDLRADGTPFILRRSCGPGEMKVLVSSSGGAWRTERFPAEAAAASKVAPGPIIVQIKPLSREGSHRLPDGLVRGLTTLCKREEVHSERKDGPYTRFGGRMPPYEPVEWAAMCDAPTTVAKRAGAAKASSAKKRAKRS